MGRQGGEGTAELRFAPPRPDPDRVIERPRLATVLAGRYERRLTVVAAPGGYGKTTLLAGAVADGSPGRDVWLACRPADADAEPFAGALLTALGRPGSVTGDAGREVIDAVWALAPTPVALVLDDVHHLGEGSTGAGLLRRLVDELPANGHLVLAGRTSPPVPLARLVAQGQAAVLVDADLLFDDDELAAVAGLAGTPVASDLTAAAGWPALVAGHVQGAGGDPVALLLDALDDHQAATVTRLCAFDDVDDELASVVLGDPVTAIEVAAGLPLCQVTEGRLCFHDLWRESLPAPTAPDVRAGVAAGVALLVDRGRFRSAYDAASWLGDDGVRAGVVEALALAELPGQPLADVTHVLDQLPDGVVGTGHRLLLEATVALGSDSADALDLLVAAAAELRAADRPQAEAVALIRQAMVYVWQADLAALGGPLARLGELAALGVERAERSLSLTAAYGALIGGDPAGAVTTVIASGALDDAVLAPLAHLLVAHGNLDLGHPDRAARAAERGLPAASGRAAAGLLGARLEARFVAGELGIEGFHADQADLEARLRALGVVENLVLHDAGVAVMALRFGDRALADRLVASAEAGLDATIGPRARMATAVAGAALALETGREADAAARLEAALAVDPPAGLPDRAYLRSIPLLYVLVPSVRPLLDAADLGPLWQEARAIARAAVAVREGDGTPAVTLGWDRPGRLRSLTPLPFLVELAVAAKAAGVTAAGSLLGGLPGDVRPWLRALVAGSGPTAAVAAELLAEVPGPPTSRLEGRVLGPTALLRDGVPVDDPGWRRERVRSLLALLARRREVTRTEAAAALWPDLDERSARNNLRVNLRHLQEVLQPDRPAEEPPWILRVVGDRLRLVVDEWFTLDVVLFEEAVAAAAAAERQASPGVALDHHLEAVARYGGDYLPAVDGDEAVAYDRVRLRSAFVASAVRAGQLLLAAGAVAEAADLAGQALAVEPLDEAAGALLAATGPPRTGPTAVAG